MRSNYFERQERKIERYEELAIKNNNLASSLKNKASSMASCIPFGQPILIGHHSEKRDRNFRNKIHNTFGKAIEASDKANYYAEKAEIAKNNNAISSDNPNAIELLKEKISEREALQERMKAANKLIRKNNKDGLAELGYTKEQIEALFTPDFCGRIGYASYSLSNNRQVIVNAKKRLAKLEKEKTEETTEQEINGVIIVDNVEDNRLQMFFDGKPSEEVRSKLKSNGFRWSPSVGCWQAYRNIRSARAALTIAQGMEV